MTERLTICGLELDGDMYPDDIAIAAVLVIEMISADDGSGSYLRLLSSDLPVWQRLGMLQCAVAVDEATAAGSFKDDEPEGEGE
jgi:Mg2+/citrate symporter